MLNFQMNRIDQAMSLEAEALRITETTIGKKNIAYVKQLHALLTLRKLTGNFSEAESKMIESFQIFSEQIKKNSGFLSEKEYKQFLSTLQSQHSNSVLQTAIRRQEGDYFQSGCNANKLWADNLQEIRASTLHSEDSHLNTLHPCCLNS